MTDSSTAIVFPGQGSQRVGMLDGLPGAETVSRLIDRATVLAGEDLRVLAANGPDDAIAQTRVAQPLLYLADWAWGTALIESGLRPAAVAGHSLGEIAALAVAGVLSAEAGLELVVKRSRLMAEAAADAPGGMAAIIGLDGPVVAAAIHGIGDVWVANDNCPGQVVISGTADGVSAAEEALSRAGARRVVPLAVSGAFHSPLMGRAAEEFSRVLDSTDFADAALPVVQNAEPSPAVSASDIRERLSRQMVSPVRWTETMAALAGMGVATLVEAGPGEVLCGLAKRVDGLDAVSASVAGVAGAMGRVA